ncbi:MAG: Cys-Gln thioester bond-forming surface protein [Oscillospiraceae bacterium]|nr:Cys-Gln thioester bond-forming surface protein [Oscillospiraceae bacterium]
MKQKRQRLAACLVAAVLISLLAVPPAGAAPDANSYTAVLHYDDGIQITYSHRTGSGPDDWWVSKGDIPLGGAELNGKPVLRQIYCADAVVPFHSYAVGEANAQAGGSSEMENEYATDRVPGYVSTSPEEMPAIIKAHWNELLWLMVNGYRGTDESVDALNDRFSDLSDNTGPLPKITMETAVMATKACVWHYTNPDVAYFGTSFLQASNGDPLSSNGIRHRQFVALMGRLIAEADAYAANPTPLNDTRLEVVIEGDETEMAAEGGSEYYGPFTVSAVTTSGEYLQDDDKIFLDLSGGPDASAIGIVNGVGGEPVQSDTIYGSRDTGPYVIRGEEFYLRVPAGYSLEGLKLRAFTRTETTVTNMPMVLVHQDPDGMQNWQTVQAFIGLADNVAATVYGEALRPLQDESHGTLTVVKMTAGLEREEPFVFRLTDGKGAPVNLGLLTGIHISRIRNAEEGLFTLPAGSSLTIGGLLLGDYRVTEIETTNTVLYRVSEDGSFATGRTASVSLTQQENAQTVTFLNVPNAPFISVRKRSGAPGHPTIEGAEFSLRREGGGYDSGVVRTNAQGGITFAGLPHYTLPAGFTGTYLLTEESVPGGRHDLLSGPVTLEIASDGRVTSVTPVEADRDLVSVEGLETDSVTITVTDVYHQPPSTARIYGRKGVRGVSSTEERFRFSLRQVADLQGTPLDAPLFEEHIAQTGGTITVGAPATFAFEEIVFPEGVSGTYYFKLTEEIGFAPNWIYDGASYVARVDVDATTSLATVSWPGTDFTYDEPPLFVNAYQPKYSIIFHGRKSISGVNSTTQTFSFTLDQVRDAAGTPLGPNDARLTETLKTSTAGTITAGASQTVTFPVIENVTAGTYYFKLTEDEGSVSGWIYDSAVHIAQVTVSADGGVKIDWPESRYSENMPPLFVNLYLPRYSVEIQGRKSVSHDTQEVFKFTLTEVRDAAGTPMGPSDLRSVATRSASTVGAITAGAPQTFSFPVIEGLVPGTYYLKITEEPGGTARWTYDSTAHIARVLVSATGPEVTWINGDPAETPLFKNTYTPPGTSGNTPPPPRPTTPTTPDTPTTPTAPTTPSEPSKPDEPDGPGPRDTPPPVPYDAGDNNPPGYGNEDTPPDGGGNTPPHGGRDMPYTGGADVAGWLLLLGLLLAVAGSALALTDSRRHDWRQRGEEAEPERE